MPDTSDLVAQGSRPAVDRGPVTHSVPGGSLLLVPNQLHLLPPHLCSAGAFQAVWNSLCCVGMFPAFRKVFLHSPVLSCSTKCSLPISWRVWVSSPRMCSGQGWCSLTLVDLVLSHEHLGIFGSCFLKSRGFLLEF